MSKFKVTTTMTNEIHFCDTRGEVNEHVSREIEWFNSPNENKTGKGYTPDDFKVEEI